MAASDYKEIEAHRNGYGTRSITSTSAIET